MNYTRVNRFQDFFEEGKYITLKNYLYNYLLRKKAVEKILEHDEIGLILEVGSGISPVMTRTEHIVYSDLSPTALRILRNTQRKGMYVATDAMHLPFKNSTFSHAIASEVLEHLRNDQEAINELARVTSSSGCLIVTFPHRKFYFANDDRFVNHFRRYELPEIADRLKDAGLRVISIQKVLGPLEKLTMSLVVFCFSVIQGSGQNKQIDKQNPMFINAFASIFKWLNRIYMVLAWLDAKIMPRSISTVLLIKAMKNHKD